MFGVLITMLLIWLLYKVFRLVGTSKNSPFGF